MYGPVRTAGGRAPAHRPSTGVVVQVRIAFKVGAEGCALDPSR